MKWNYWITLFLETHCTACGLRSTSIAAYASLLRFFHAWVDAKLEGREPDRIKAVDILQYVEFLRTSRSNGQAAVNRVVTVLRSFFRAMVSLEHLDPRDNPMANFPRMKAPKRKFAETLDAEEVKRLIGEPGTDTEIGMRDRTLIVLLYATGIRASECAGLKEKDVDLDGRTVRVIGKGGHERTVPLNVDAVKALSEYKLVRGPRERQAPFFKSRKGNALSRGAIYERVRTHARRAHVVKKVSPHRIRHTFATHLVRAGVPLVTLRDLLGHRQLSSTQIYIHMTADDLRKATDLHPISGLLEPIRALFAGIKLPFQKHKVQERA